MDTTEPTYERARGIHALTEAEWREAGNHLPAAIGIKHLPASAARAAGVASELVETPSSRWARFKFWLFGR